MPSILGVRGGHDEQQQQQYNDDDGRDQEAGRHIQVTIPTPLPFIISLLPLLLSPQAFLPASHLSTFVLLRHHFLKPLPPSSPSYLQASPRDEVEEAREYLAQFAQCLEEIELSQVDYSTRIEEFGRITARVRLHKDGRRLVLLVIWEEAQEIQQHQPSGEQGGDVVEAGWRYYDLQLPTPAAATSLPGVWHSDVSSALKDLMVKKNRNSSGVDNNAESAPPAANPCPNNHVPEQEDVRGRTEDDDEGEGGNPDDDFWAGVEDSDTEEGSGNGNANASLEADNEDDYWASYGSQDSESAIPDETAPPPPNDERHGDLLNGSYGGGFESETTTANGHQPHPSDHAEQPTPRTAASPTSSPSNSLHASDRAEEALRQNIRSLYNLYQLSSTSSSPSESPSLPSAERFLDIVKEELRCAL